MAQTFIGFNTINQYKKFTLTDFELIKRDLANAFNIRQGELPGRPDYGTIMWNFLFENQIEELQNSIVAEVHRVAGGDPRVFISDIQVFPEENGIMIQLEVTVTPSTDATRLGIFFDIISRRASFV